LKFFSNIRRRPLPGINSRTVARESREYTTDTVASSSSAVPLSPEFSPSHFQPGVSSIPLYESVNEDPSHRRPTVDDILNMVLGNCNITAAKANIIAQTLDEHFQSIDLPIFDFRAWSTVEFFTDEDSCSLLEWMEGNDRHVMVLIKVPELDIPVTRLSHTFALKAEYSWVSWETTDFQYLKELMRAAQHLHHLFQWPMEDLLRLCSDKEPDGYETFPPLFLYGLVLIGRSDLEELGELLFDHEEDLMEVAKSVEEMIPLLRAASTRTGTLESHGLRFDNRRL